MSRYNLRDRPQIPFLSFFFSLALFLFIFKSPLLTAPFCLSWVQRSSPAFSPISTNYDECGERSIYQWNDELLAPLI